MPLFDGTFAIGQPIGTTLLASYLVGSLITRSGPTAAFTDTTDTAANINAQLGGRQGAPTQWAINIVNQTSFAMTIAAGTGVTLSGVTLIPANSTAIFMLTSVSATAVTMFGEFESGTTDPSSSVTLFGGGTGTMPALGLLYRQVNVPPTGVSPGATGADNVIAVYSLPAGSFDAANREINIIANGFYGGNGNTKRIKIIVNPATAVVGSTVGAGGTTIADTGAVTTNAGAWLLSGTLIKYGAAASNTQMSALGQAQSGATVVALVSPALVVGVESAAILIAITGNATTTATDIVLDLFQVAGAN